MSKGPHDVLTIVKISLRFNQKPKHVIISLFEVVVTCSVMMYDVVRV
jgi:hypothetical protein